MCGITGIISSSPEEVSNARIRKMSATLAHRGPDGEGYYASGDSRAAFGHKRLAIIDLSEAASQPMKYLDRYVITYNGEIYNYKELRSVLEKKGYSFRSNSDTEVLLALYDHKKEKCLSDLDGMFAFAIYDEKEKQLFCARDRFGEKPFFYSYRKGKSLLFGSEIKALLAGGIPRMVNHRMLYNYLAWNYVNNPLDGSETFYEGIKKLPAAHYLIVDQDLGLSVKRYWDIDYKIQDKEISFEEASEKVRRLMAESVSFRLRSDVPVGSCLSGGLDSSVIVNLIARSEKTTLKTFSARFRDFEKDEGKYMDAAVRGRPVERHDVFVDEDALIATIDRIFYHQEEPFLSSSIAAQHEVMRAAKENGVKVLLDGQGSDELFGGYDYLVYAWFQELFAKDKKKYREEWKKFSAISPFPIERKPKFYLQALLPSFYPQFEKIKSFRKPANADMINSDFQKAYSKKSFQTSIRSKPDFNYMLHESACGEAMEQILRYADRNSMAHSVEVRLPFLSHKLAEFVFSLPASLKIRDGWPKYLLRKSFEDILPSEIAWRKDKVGFETPQSRWLSTPKMKSAIQESKHLLIKEKVLNEKALNSSDNDWQYLMGAKMIGM